MTKRRQSDRSGHADRAARRPKSSKIGHNPCLRAYIEDRLAGRVIGSSGKAHAGPEVAWTKRRSVRRQHRRWGWAWSPEQIARRLPIDYPYDESMRISHEAIYQALYIQGRGALKREPIAGHGAEAVRKAICSSIRQFPPELCKSLTWDQGAEMAQHDKITDSIGLPIYFCNPQSPWQRGTNENTNGLLRQYFPKGTDLSCHSKEELEAVAFTLNNRPRKTLGWKTPAEAMENLLK